MNDKLQFILRNKIFAVSIALIIIITISAIVYPQVSPFEYDKVDLTTASEQPSLLHPLGTDTLGRDMLTRILYGARISIGVGLIVALVSTFTGMLIGMFAGFFGGWIDELLMRLTDLALILPMMPVLMVAGAFFSKGGILGISLVLSFLLWMYVARVVRASFLSLKKSDYIQAAKVSGCSDQRIIFVHMLPAVSGQILVNALITLSLAITSESILSFLGFGIQPPVPSWGNMLYESKNYASDQPWLVWGPGIFILLTLISVNYICEFFERSLRETSERSQ